MTTQKSRLAALVLAAALSGTAHAELQGRDLDGNAATFEAYYDTALDITWLADANYSQTSGYDADGRMSWVGANTWAANLSIVDSANNITYDNWRLPSVDPVNGVSYNNLSQYDGSSDVGYNITSPNSEMAYMFYVNLGNLGAYTPDGASSGCLVLVYPYSDNCVENVGPFSNLQSKTYWSESDGIPNYSENRDAWTFTPGSGYQARSNWAYEYHAWAVSSGDVGAVPEADTWAMLLAGLGLVGAVTRRRSKPEAAHPSE